jgi:hypothetical protein
MYPFPLIKYEKRSSKSQKVFTFVDKYRQAHEYMELSTKIPLKYMEMSTEMAIIYMEMSIETP